MNKTVQELEQELAALEKKTKPTEPRKEPTREFVEYRLHHEWTQIPDPKPSFEKWSRSIEATEMVRRHDQKVAENVERARHSFDDYLRANGLEQFIENFRIVNVLGAEAEYSWRWQHSRLSSSNHLSYTPTSSYALLR